MIRVCDGPAVLHALLQQQHRQPGGVGALLWNGAAVSFSDGRLEVEGYLIPRGALDARLHTRRLREREGGVPQAPQDAGIGRDVLPQNVG
jgi:hypothetical protein